MKIIEVTPIDNSPHSNRTDAGNISELQDQILQLQAKINQLIMVINELKTN